MQVQLNQPQPQRMLAMLRLIYCHTHTHTHTHTSTFSGFAISCTHLNDPIGDLIEPIDHRLHRRRSARLRHVHEIDRAYLPVHLEVVLCALN